MKKGEDIRAEIAREKKSCMEALREEREARNAPATKKREEEAEKSAEAATPKAETRQLAKQEEKEPKKHVKKQKAELLRLTEQETDIQKKVEEEKRRKSRVADEKEYAKSVLVKNTNRKGSCFADAIGLLTIEDRQRKQRGKRVKVSCKGMPRTHIVDF